MASASPKYSLLFVSFGMALGINRLDRYAIFFPVVIVFWNSLFSFSYAEGRIDQDVIQKLDEAIELQGMSSKSRQKKKEKGSWLPVPIPVTDPTIGSGLFTALLYMHPPKSGDNNTPTATSGIGALYTDSKSWFTGAFHDDYLNNDQYRYKVVAGTGKFNLDYYGVGDDSELKDHPVAYSIESDVALLQFLTRIRKSSDWYAGVRYLWSVSGVRFEAAEDASLPDESTDLTTSSLGVVTTYDSRNDTFYPTSGQYFELFWSVDSDVWGSDFDYDKLSSFYNYYWSVSNKSTIAMRGDVSTVDGDAPFYMLPTLKMRGFPAGQYRNQSAISGHIEWRYKIKPRWATILFSELGAVGRTVSAAIDESKVKSYGLGFRWQVLPSQTLNLGVDVGFSGDDSAIYIQVGERY